MMKKIYGETLKKVFFKWEEKDSKKDLPPNGFLQFQLFQKLTRENSFQIELETVYLPTCIHIFVSEKPLLCLRYLFFGTRETICSQQLCRLVYISVDYNIN